MLNIGVLVSGGGTNLQALIDAEKSGVLHSGRIVTVVSSSAKAYALTRAADNGIPSKVIRKKDFKTPDEFDAAIAQHMKACGVDLIVMAGFLCVVGKQLIDCYKNAIINVHPSLIPAFCGDGFYGLRVHEGVLNYGVKVTGATVHFVNEVTDGGSIILQKAVKVEAGDTPEILQKRVMHEAEWSILPQAAELFCAGKLCINNRVVTIKE